MYLFAFNYAPESVRTTFALAVLSLSQRPQIWQTAILLSIAMTIGCWLVTHGMNSDSKQFDTAEALRSLAIYVMPLWLLAFPEVIPHRFVIVLAVGGTVVGGILALSGPPVYAGGTPRLASITGGITQYNGVRGHLFWCRVYRARCFLGPTILLALLILLGYGGRRAMVLVGTYFATLGYFRFRGVQAVRWCPPILVVLFAIASAVALTYGHDAHSWGSGRIGVWQYRLCLRSGVLGSARVWPVKQMRDRNLSEFPRSKAQIQGWFAGIALARSD